MNSRVILRLICHICENKDIENYLFPIVLNFMFYLIRPHNAIVNICQKVEGAPKFIEVVIVTIHLRFPISNSIIQYLFLI